MVIHFFQEFYFLITISCFLNMQYFNFHSVMQLFSTFISGIIFLLILPQQPLVVFHLFVGSQPTKEYLSKQATLNTFGPMYRHLRFVHRSPETGKEEVNTYALNYTWLFYTRRYLFVALNFLLTANY